MSWPYKNIEQSDFEDVLRLVENIIVEHGGILTTVTEENEAYYSTSGLKIKELVKQNVFRFRDEFVRVDRLYYSDKPSIVLEFSDCVEGPYEDADPFPYDLPSDEIVKDIKQAMLIIPYPDWHERAKREKWMPKTGNLLIWRNQYAIYNEWGNAYLVNIETRERILLGSYYGDPEIALLDSKEKNAIVAGVDGIGIYDIENREFKSIDISIPEWIISIDIIEKNLRIICEEGKIYEFSI